MKWGQNCLSVGPVGPMLTQIVLVYVAICRLFSQKHEGMFANEGAQPFERYSFDSNLSWICSSAVPVHPLKIGPTSMPRKGAKWDTKVTAGRTSNLRLSEPAWCCSL